MKGPVRDVRVRSRNAWDGEPLAFTMLGKGSAEGTVRAGAIEKGPLGRTQEPGHCQPTVQKGAPGISNQIPLPPSYRLCLPPANPTPALCPGV